MAPPHAHGGAAPVPTCLRGTMALWSAGVSLPFARSCKTRGRDARAPFGGLMTTVTAETAPRAAFADVWLISAGHMMNHWYPGTFYLLLPLIGNELGLSFSQIGSILTCQFAAGALSNIPGGILVDA